MAGTDTDIADFPEPEPAIPRALPAGATSCPIPAAAIGFPEADSRGGFFFFYVIQITERPRGA